MKGPGNVSVRLDLFPNNNKKVKEIKTEPDAELKSRNSEDDFFLTEDSERSNRQVVFLNAEWDEIEEEKAGIPSFVDAISCEISNDKTLSSNFMEFVPTDSESGSSITVSLDDYGEDSDDIVAVISGSEVVKSGIVTETRMLCNKKLAPETLKKESHLPFTKIIKNKSFTNVENSKSRNEEPAENSKIIKASCYVVQNGKITKPFYIVKKSPAVKEEAEKSVPKVVQVPATPDQIKTLVPLEKCSGRRKEIGGEIPRFCKSGRSPPDPIRIIEHPPRERKRPRSDENRGAPLKNSETNGAKFCKNSIDSGTNSCESEDLMWLLDFKLDDLFSESALPALSHLDDGLEQISDFPSKFVDVDGSVPSFGENDGDKIRVEIGCQTETTTAKQNKSANGKLGLKQQQLKLESKGEGNAQNRTFNDLRYSENRKPPFTYTELIECALQEKGPLTVSEIYHWISETFPYYKSWDDRWKNSVRHNLSINPYFRKGTKARQGSGHLWTVNKSEDTSKINSWKRQRFQEFEEFNKRLKLAGENEKLEESLSCASPSRMLDETAMATASIEDKENRRLHRDVLMAACVDNNLSSSANVSLEQSAEEILSGVKKTVEVQYLEPIKSSSPCENDFLNPISKEILMGECGLLNQIELNLTAEAGEHLGIVESMGDSEHIFGISDDLNFQYDIAGHTPQLLSLAK